ncbi:MAG: histone-like protein 2 [Clostridia bacterium]|nr:histone-like protein 2 [Clostridia bacterium]
MPIGKNAIKRVANNGYSKVKTEAPDMENSVVEIKAEEKKSTKAPSPKKEAVNKPAAKKASATAAEKTAAAKKETVKKESVKKAPAKTSAKKTAPKPSMESEPDFAPTKTLEKITETAERCGAGYVNLGGKMPDYLL